MTLHKIKEKTARLRTLPLESILLLSGAKQDRYDKAKWHTTQGAISVKGMKFINWNQGRGGGGAIDLVIHLQRLSFTAAIAWMDGHFPVARLGEQMYSKHRPLPKTKLILPPKDRSKLSRIRHYLLRDRSIPRLLLQHLTASGRLYADNRSNAVFLLLGCDNKPVGAELRGTTKPNWRGLATGTRKNLGYFSISSYQSKTIVLCESAIDAISCHVLHPHYLCISTSGARPNPPWLYSLIKKNNEIYCGFDADNTGDNIAQNMITLYPNIKRLRPLLHDWNDVLRSKSYVQKLILFPDIAGTFS